MRACVPVLACVLGWWWWWWWWWWGPAAGVVSETYRYTPLLAWVLLPNVWGSMVFGKVLFIAADLLCAYFLYDLLAARGVDGATARRWVALGWLFNPFVVTITTRGSAEAVVAALVLGTLWALYHRHVVAAAVVFGLAVQFKAYAVLYALPLYFFLNGDYTGRAPGGATWLGALRRLLSPTRVTFALVSAGTFLGLSAWMYHLYGWQFVEETFLYHITRRDHRHNFSPYFYLLYLNADGAMPAAVSVLSFVPQLVLLIVLGAWFYRDPPFCLFVQTIAFVAFNKVCTSQYFIWYITFLPLVWPSLRVRIFGTGGAVIGVWLVTQVRLSRRAHFRAAPHSTAGTNVCMRVCVWGGGAPLSSSNHRGFGSISRTNSSFSGTIPFGCCGSRAWRFSWRTLPCSRTPSPSTPVGPSFRPARSHACNARLRSRSSE